VIEGNLVKKFSNKEKRPQDIVFEML